MSRADVASCGARWVAWWGTRSARAHTPTSALSPSSGAPPTSANSRAAAWTPRALDGDTLLLPGGERLRLDGLDTPERGRPGADAATRAVQRWLDAGRWRLHPPTPPRDVYGRLLGTLRDDTGRDLGALLLAHGLAWIYRDADPARRALQAAAVAAETGVHADLARLPGPFLVSAASFHRPDCALVRERGRALPWEVSAQALLKAGRAPCRRCLRWPPRRAAVR